MTSPVGGFDPQPCGDGPEIPAEVTIIGPDPLNVAVVGSVTVAEPVTVDGTVSVNEPIDVIVSPNPLPVTGTVIVSPNPLPVTGTVSSGGSTAAATTLSAVSAIGNGTTVDFTSARSNVSLFVMVNGTVTTGVVDLQASQDGVNWVKVASSAALSTGINQRITHAGGAFRWFRGVVSETVVGGGTATATLMFA